MSPSLKRRKHALKQVADAVCRDRQNTHGDPEDNFADIARIWSVQLRHKLCEPLDGSDVALLMVAVKLVRSRENKTHADNWHDMAGYAVCGAAMQKPLANPTA